MVVLTWQNQYSVTGCQRAAIFIPCQSWGRGSAGLAVQRNGIVNDYIFGFTTPAGV